MQAKQTILPGTVVSRKSGFITSEIDDETVMMSVELGRYFGLDAVGSRIWELIQSSRKVSDLIDLLLEEFEVDRQVCETDVLKFLTLLHEKQMITCQ